MLIILTIAVAAGLIWLAAHQRTLRLRAETMEEAISNHDFTFRLPVGGLLSGEKAMQEALNRLGEMVREQVGRKEVEAWERMTRVLTHEIMNATAPIASISQSLLARPDVKGTPLEEGLQAISNTSTHLNTFVESFRKFSELQRPVLTHMDLGALVAEVGALFPQMERKTHFAAGTTIHADAGMMRQVLTNLLKNAAEAGAKSVSLSIDGRVLFVGNDGQGMPADCRDSVFVPFFTTKRTGSGVGLPLSRRMMMAQGGNLELSDKPLPLCSVTFAVSLPN